MIDQRTLIWLDADDCRRAVEFAHKINENCDQAETDFGRRDLIRKISDRNADTVEGKLAEIGVQKFLRIRSPFQVALDFQVYPGQENGDSGQDLSLVKLRGASYRLDKKVDIKATREGSQWLLVEAYKFLADVYIIVRVRLPFDFEKKYKSHTVDRACCEIAGFVYKDDLLFLDGRPWFSFPRDSRLFNLRGVDKPTVSDSGEFYSWLEHQRQVTEIHSIGGPLKAELNYGMPIHWLRSGMDEWYKLFRWLEEHFIPGKT